MIRAKHNLALSVQTQMVPADERVCLPCRVRRRKRNELRKLHKAIRIDIARVGKRISDRLLRTVQRADILERTTAEDENIRCEGVFFLRAGNEHSRNIVGHRARHDALDRDGTG